MVRALKTCKSCNVIRGELRPYEKKLVVSHVFHTWNFICGKQIRFMMFHANIHTNFINETIVFFSYGRPSRFGNLKALTSAQLTPKFGHFLLSTSGPPVPLQKAIRRAPSDRTLCRSSSISSPCGTAPTPRTATSHCARPFWTCCASLPTSVSSALDCHGVKKLISKANILGRTFNAKSQNAVKRTSSSRTVRFQSLRWEDAFSEAAAVRANG